MHFSNISCNRKQSKAREIRKYATKECFSFKKVLGKQQVQDNYWDLIPLLCHKKPKKSTTNHSCLPRPRSGLCSYCSLFKQDGVHKILQRSEVPHRIRAFSPVTLTCRLTFNLHFLRSVREVQEIWDTPQKTWMSRGKRRHSLKGILKGNWPHSPWKSQQLILKTKTIKALPKF